MKVLVVTTVLHEDSTESREQARRAIIAFLGRQKPEELALMDLPDDTRSYTVGVQKVD